MLLGVGSISYSSSTYGRKTWLFLFSSCFHSGQKAGCIVSILHCRNFPLFLRGSFHCHSRFEYCISPLYFLVPLEDSDWCSLKWEQHRVHNAHCESVRVPNHIQHDFLAAGWRLRFVTVVGVYLSLVCCELEHLPLPLESRDWRWDFLPGIQLCAQSERGILLVKPIYLLREQP